VPPYPGCSGKKAIQGITGSMPAHINLAHGEIVYNLDYLFSASDSLTTPGTIKLLHCIILYGTVK